MTVDSLQRRILIVEDDEGLREIIASSIERLGHQPLTASRADEAFQIVLKNPDLALVLSDIRMPGGSGMDLLKKIQLEVATPPPVVLMTGFTDVIFNDAMKAGARAILAKPFAVRELAVLIQEILGSSLELE